MGRRVLRFDRPLGRRVVVAHEAELSGKKSSPSGGKVVRQHQKGCISIGRQPGCEGFHCHRQCFPRNQLWLTCKSYAGLTQHL